MMIALAERIRMHQKNSQSCKKGCALNVFKFLFLLTFFLSSYEVLKDDGKRKAYDTGGFGGMGDNDGGSGFSSGGFYGSGFESMGGNEAFANFWQQAFGGNNFSGFGTGRPPSVEVQVSIVFPTRCAALSLDLLQVRLSFLEAANGCKRKVFVNIDKPCSTCNGTAAKPGTKAEKCKTCGGIGRVVKTKGSFQTIRLIHFPHTSSTVPK